MVPGVWIEQTTYRLQGGYRSYRSVPLRTA